MLKSRPNLPTARPSQPPFHSSTNRLSPETEPRLSAPWDDVDDDTSLSEGMPDSIRHSESIGEGRQSTAVGARRIFRRFVFVLVVFDFFVGTGVLAYEFFDSRQSMHEKLDPIGALANTIVQKLQAESPEAREQDVLLQASQLTGYPMGLVTKDGQLAYVTDPAIPRMFERVFEGGIDVPSQRYPVRGDFGPLSGGWFARPFSKRHDVLVVVPFAPESEGLIMYLSISAGVLAFSVAASVLVMLGTANWMLHRPLARLEIALTGALRKDVERRRAAEHTAIRARLEAEAHLAFLDNLINATDHVGVVASGADDKIQLINRTAEAILGFSRAEAVGSMTLNELMNRCRRRSVHEVPLRSLMKLQEGEVFVTDGTGTERIVAVTYSDINDPDGTANGRLMMFIDMTERRRLEVELKANEMQLVQSSKLAGLGEMATGIAHELNQPLNNISLLASRVTRKLAQSGEPRDFEIEKLRIIQSQVQRASKIIDQLRTFGRPNVLQVESIHIQRPVYAVLDLTREQFENQGIEVVVDIPGDLPKVFADEQQLEQVLINLLNNARDAFGDLAACVEPPRIRLKAETDVPPGGPPRVYLHVQDNGVGMSEDTCSRVFQPFFTTKEVGKGTGLGLSISYSLVRGFGGTLTFQSRLGEGTTFSILLSTVPAANLQKDVDA